MKEEEKYKQHIKEGWCFAQKTANELASESDLRPKLALAIFEKIVSPLHYFLQDGEQGASQPPSEQQLKFAYVLGIVNPEQYSKQELSLKIGEALKAKRKNGEGA